MESLVKTCTKCLLPKELNEFHKDSTSKDGHNSKCKECRKIVTTNSGLHVPWNLRVITAIENLSKSNKLV